MSRIMEHIDELFEYFLWWEEHNEEMDACKRYDWICIIRELFQKECESLFRTNPEAFHALRNTREFTEQIALYNLTHIISAIQ